MQKQKVSAARFVSVPLLSLVHRRQKQFLLVNQPHLLAISTKYYGVQSRLSIGCLVELGNGQIVSCRAKSCGAPVDRGVVRVRRLDRHFFGVQPKSETVVTGILDGGLKCCKGDIYATALKRQEHAT